MKVKSIGELELKEESSIRSYNINEEHKTMQTTQWNAFIAFSVIKEKNHHFCLLFVVQLDSCTRQNKNKYLMAYSDELVSWYVFKEVLVGFLPVGYTDEYIYEEFSRNSQSL